MSFFQQSRRFLTAIALVLLLTLTTACGGAATAREPQVISPTLSQYSQLERGNSAVGQDFGNWVVSASKGLISDAYVRDNNKLGVVISPQVRPTEVKDLTKSLAQGFHKNFPNQDLTILMYAPDKKLIMTAVYDEQTQQLEYKVS